MIVPEDISNAILVTHAGCLDGAASEVVFVLAGGDRQNVRKVPPSGVDKFVRKNPDIFDSSDRFVFFVDVTPHSSDIIERLETRGNVVVVDHHKTAMGLVGRSWCTIDSSRCASFLFKRFLEMSYERFAIELEEIGPLVEFVDDHDRWQNTSYHSDELAIFMKTVGFGRFVDRFLDEPDVAWSLKERETIDIAIEKRSKYIEKMLKRVTLRVVDGLRVGYIIANEHVSYLLHEALRANPIDLAAAVDLDNRVVSLRSLDEKFDCSRFAEARGGGGHACSAAYSLDRSVIDGLVDEVAR